MERDSRHLSLKEQWSVPATLTPSEELVDLEDDVPHSGFRHPRTVARTIGFTAGTGGSSGVGYLQLALEHMFLPEVFAVGAEIGR